MPLSEADTKAKLIDPALHRIVWNKSPLILEKDEKIKS